MTIKQSLISSWKKRQLNFPKMIANSFEGN